MKTAHFKHPFTALIALGTLAFMACSSDPTGIHSEPAGVELVLNGAVIATYQADPPMWTGAMEVDVGMETEHISVYFLDDGGDRITFDADYYLEVEVTDETIAEFEQDTPGEFGGHLHGLAQGVTDVVFSLMHGAIGSGHADFATQAVVAQVN